MENINRTDIQVISRLSNLSSNSIEGILKDNVYNKKEAWHKFLNLLFISSAIGFTVIGIVLFYIYNWENLHRFLKIGIVEIILIPLIIKIVYTNTKEIIRNILITISCVLVGTLFAVYGIIYNVIYDFGDLYFWWSFFITVWVIIYNFKPLNYFYYFLLAITFISNILLKYNFYYYINIVTLLHILLLVVLIIFNYDENNYKKYHVSKLTTNIFAVLYAVFSSVIINYEINLVNENKFINTEIIDTFYFAYFAIPVSYAFSIAFSIQKKKLFYIGIIYFSFIIIFSNILIKIFDLVEIKNFVGIFIIFSFILSYFLFKYLQKKWNS